MLVTGYGEENDFGVSIAQDSTGYYIRQMKIHYFSCTFI